MRKNTDLNRVKSVALALLYTDVYETEYSPVIVQHPFTNSGMIAYPKSSNF